MDFRKIAFIGAGNMVRAIVGGLVGGDYPASYITACAPTTSRRQVLASEFGINHSANNIEAANEADVIILAVKPQMMSDVCLLLKQQIDFTGKLVISIAAGLKVEHYYRILGEGLNIIRVMPNTPALVGLGMSGLFSPAQVNQADRLFCENLMQSVGKICWVDNEGAINSIIAVAGSAPAYFYLFMQSIQQQAEKLGFDTETAKIMVQQTALGAVTLADRSLGLSFQTLREQVTSKGGTTAEAVRVFQEKALPEIVAEAMNAAIARAEELENALMNND